MPSYRVNKFFSRPLVKVVGIAFATCVAVCAIIYFTGMFSVWQDARRWQKEVDAQKSIAAEEKEKRIAAESDAAGWKGVAEDYKSKAEYQEGISHELRTQMQTALQELGESRAATASSSRAYDEVRSRPLVVRPDDTPDALSGRLRAGAAEFRGNRHD